MAKWRLNWIVSVILVMMVIAGGMSAQEATNGMTIDILNVRAGPGVDYTAFTQIGARVPVMIEGRNSFGNWILIHTPDNAIRGWVASRYVAVDEGVELGELPVTDEVIAGYAPEDRAKQALGSVNKMLNTD